MKKIVLLIGAALLAAGCASYPKILINNEFIGGRGVKYYMVPAGLQSADMAQSGAQQTFHFGLHVCDYTPEGKETNCSDTTVLEYVYPQSIY